jgi:LysM repeat protein
MKHTQAGRTVWRWSVMTLSAATVGLTMTGCLSGREVKLLGSPNVPAPYLQPPEDTVVPSSSTIPVVPATSHQSIVPLAPPPDIPVAATPLPPMIEHPVIIDEPGSPSRVLPPVVDMGTPPPDLGRSLTYTVKKGDSLWGIGRMYGVSTKELAAANNMSEDAVLKIGKVLIPPENRPVIKRTTPTASKTVSPTAEVTHKFVGKEPIPANGQYEVKAGDSLWEIAKRFGLSVQDIKTMNNLQNDKLQVKQVLTLRAGAGAAVAPVASRPVAPAADTTALTTPGGTAVTPPAADVTATDVSALKMLPHYCDPGDTLKTIATMYDSKVEWILKVNEGIKTDADLKQGLKLNVPVEEQ